LKGLLQSPREPPPFAGEKEVIESFNVLPWSQSTVWKGYGFRSLNQYGDINVESRPTEEVFGDFERGKAYINEALFYPISDHFLSIYSQLLDLVQEKGGKLILTWPVTVRNPLFDLSKPDHQNKAMYFQERLTEKSVDICCNPALFNLHVKFFFNTMEHTNRYGAMIRSVNLGQCLKRILQRNICNGMEFDEALEFTKSMERIYSAGADSFPNAGAVFYNTAKDDLNRIRKALAEYYRDNKRYPTSSGLDGLYTNYGRSGEDWIQGLAPGYIEALPRDPRYTSDGDKQYFYISNGADYKLISHLAEDCEIAAKLDPELVDPVRNCWAYGYWTEGAANW
jgi:hypothetical protein